MKAACDARRDSDFMIRARTDAAATDGIPEVIDRLNLYGEAGADIVFADALLSVEDIATVAKNVNKPLAVNMGFGLIERGTTPLVTPRRLQELGVATVSYARMLTSAALRGMMNALEAFAPTITRGQTDAAPRSHGAVRRAQRFDGTENAGRARGQMDQRMICRENKMKRVLNPRARSLRRCSLQRRRWRSTISRSWRRRRRAAATTAPRARSRPPSRRKASARASA